MNDLALLCVHPHPDDESIACGGVLARAADTGIRTVVVTCTGGEEGENLAGIDLGDIALADHRRQELADAIAVLNVGRHYELGYRDSGMVGSPANDHPASFHRADIDEAARKLASVIRAERPHVVVSDDERGTYGHPDHIKANLVTSRAVDLAADPEADVDGAVWTVAKRYVHVLTRGRIEAIEQALADAGLPSPFSDPDADAGPDADDGSLSEPAAEAAEFGVADDQVTTEVDVAPWLELKRAAMAAHRSQIGEDSFFLNLPNDVAARAFAVEQFALRDGELGVGQGLEHDLFDGLRDGPTSHQFRDVMGRFVTGVAILTTLVDGVPHGMTANAVASLSLDPMLVLVCIDRSATMLPLISSSGVFGLSFLPEGHADRSLWFADPDRGSGSGQFDDISTFQRATGAPLLVDHAGWVDCRLWDVHEGGDHMIVVGQVVDLGVDGAGPPLVYRQGEYGGFAVVSGSRRF